MPKASMRDMAQAVDINEGDAVRRVLGRKAKRNLEQVAYPPLRREQDAK